MTETTPKKEKAPKPKYNMAQNTWYMIKLAWTEREKKVLVLCLLTAFTAVATDLINLYVSPTLLAAVERHAPIPELMQLIVFFTLALMLTAALTAYLDANILYGKITVRMVLIAALNRKGAITSYPNLYADPFLKLYSKSFRAVNSNWGAGEAIWNTLTAILTSLLGLLIYVRLLTPVQPILIVVIAVTAITNYVVSHYTSGYEYRHREEVAGYTRQMTYLLKCPEKVNMAKDIRIFGLRPWLEELYHDAEAAYTAFARRSATAELPARLTALLTAFLRNGIAYAYLIGMILRDSLTVSEFLLMFTAVSGLSQLIGQTLHQVITLHKQSLEISTLREYIEYPEPFRFEDGEPLTVQPERSYELKLENVSFRYPGAEKDTLTNINLTLHPGEKLAVVGVNGAGKTTLIKLLCGFLDPTEGRVLLNGTDIRRYNRCDYYRMFSAVFQTFNLLPSTIAANIAQSEDNIDRERVKVCAGMAGLCEKIESLPQGYDTRLNRDIYEDAVMLSGGETQRLMLARALYKDAPFIILDEPTAALDPISESELYQKYHEMTNGKSSVYISHRLASTRFCDRIIMIADGGICEEGTHQELVQAGGAYAALYEVQSKYYK